MADSEKDPLTYKEAGVDIDAGNKAVRLIAPLAQSTFDSKVLSDIGAFSGLYSLTSLDYKDPVLVSSTDGVGTKLRVAILADRHNTVGIDLVAMSVNDILAQGARPLFFLDYLAMGVVVPEKVASLVSGVVNGCRQAGCALLGGETAEMPGFYPKEDYDLAGFAVGIVERESIIDGSNIALGHEIIGIPSSGLHSNGYSLVRRIIFDELGLSVDSPLLDSTVGEILLTPTRIYAAPVLAALKRYPISGIVHVTGGGLLENIPRVLPVGCRATLRSDRWQPHPIFEFLAKAGRLGPEELYRTFNMGLGLLLMVPPNVTDLVIGILEDFGEEPTVVGRIEQQVGKQKVVIT
ncbi:MAG: phosphoribosylformylglycinamidine cyclo-ligase [Deltaproteobacteria bacterium]|jgi:phosphoribosylformylglycinamidine cyclo-ligase|nr:phosphoribosylformylglycinamidine cyclo-ligase [Deltaproteobacteria bacterium]